MASDFIQIGGACRHVKHITAVDFMPDGTIFVASVSDPPGECLTLQGPSAAAFRNWWETEASVNVLYTELEEAADEQPA